MLQGSNWEEKHHNLHIWKKLWQNNSIRFDGDHLQRLKRLFSLILAVLIDEKKI